MSRPWHRDVTQDLRVGGVFWYPDQPVTLLVRERDDMHMHGWMMTYLTLAEARDLRTALDERIVAIEQEDAECGWVEFAREVESDES